MNILTILAHPSKTSFSHALMKQYEKGAKQNHKVKSLILSDLKFDPILHEGYKKIQPLEPDLIKAQKLIKWADKIILFYPIWWTSFPALLKGFFDRTFLPGFGFSYTNSWQWEKLLKGKTARTVVTMDAPLWYYKIIAGEPSYKVMKGTLGFCGISPIKKTYISSLKSKSKIEREKILEKIYKIGLSEK